jgi:hypothetical protein
MVVCILVYPLAPAFEFVHSASLVFLFLHNKVTQVLHLKNSEKNRGFNTRQVPKNQKQSQSQQAVDTSPTT